MCALSSPFFFHSNQTVGETVTYLDFGDIAFDIPNKTMWGLSDISTTNTINQADTLWSMDLSSLDSATASTPLRIVPGSVLTFAQIAFDCQCQQLYSHVSTSRQLGPSDIVGYYQHRNTSLFPRGSPPLSWLALVARPGSRRYRPPILLRSSLRPACA